ncbi:MAG: HNH endonuclease signature motif containing protein [Candidatus Omnitrophota bacterium]
MARGNVAKVVKDGTKIVKRLRRLEVTLTKLCIEYHCGYSTLKDVVRSYISAAEWGRLRRKLLARGGVKTRFKKGHHTWNKGLHYNPGGRSIETRFKKGHLHGKAARNWRPIGTITIRHDKPPKRLRHRKRKEGLPPWRGKPRRWIKVKDDGQMSRRWIPYARYLWEQKYGPVPAGYLIVHVDGNQMNDVIDNLTIVDRRQYLALQIKRDPGHIVRMRTAAGNAARKRHEANRQLKALYGPQRIIFECRSCGFDYHGRKPPQRCIKCGSYFFEKIRRRVKEAV